MKSHFTTNEPEFKLTKCGIIWVGGEMVTKARSQTGLMIGKRETAVIFRMLQIVYGPALEESVLNKVLRSEELKKKLVLAFTVCLRRSWDELIVRERQVLAVRYGLREGKPLLSLGDTAEKFGLTKERIRQILREAEVKLKPLKPEELRGLLV